MAGRSAQGRRASQDVGLLVRTPDYGRRSHSIGDDTPRPTALLYGPSSSASVHSAVEPRSPLNLFPITLADQLASTKKLGFFGDKLLSSSSGSSNATLHPNSNIIHQLPPRSQSRTDTLASVSRDTTASPAPGMAGPSNQANKGHTSPSKVS